MFHMPSSQLFQVSAVYFMTKMKTKFYRDFKIMANDGEIKTSKYLLYLSTNYFHDLVTANPFASTTVLDFNREIIEKVQQTFSSNLPNIWCIEG